MIHHVYTWKEQNMCIGLFLGIHISYETPSYCSPCFLVSIMCLTISPSPDIGKILLAPIKVDVREISFSITDFWSLNLVSYHNFALLLSLCVQIPVRQEIFWHTHIPDPRLIRRCVHIPVHVSILWCMHFPEYLVVPGCGRIPGCRIKLYRSHMVVWGYPWWSAWVYLAKGGSLAPPWGIWVRLRLDRRQCRRRCCFSFLSRLFFVSLI